MFGDLHNDALRWRAEVIVLIDKTLAGHLKTSGCCGEEENLLKQVTVSSSSFLALQTLVCSGLAEGFTPQISILCFLSPCVHFQGFKIF
jgi:hypothetical protein